MRQHLRRVIAQLQVRERDLAITLRSLGDAVIATDAEGRVRRMNPVAEHLTGWSDGAAFGMEGFVRLNFGCPRSLLDEGLRRLRTALA